MTASSTLNENGTAIGPTGGIFTIAGMDKDALTPAPINPDWILDGSPEALCANLSAGTRGWAYTNHWSCTAGTFRWQYRWDESVLFLEGEVTITDDAGRVYEGRPGVSLFFPAGTSAVWHVPAYIRKIAFNQKPVPWYLHKISRVTERLQRLLGQEVASDSGLGG
ncbi:cupin domain-containing protein [Roseibium sp.]|uniref:cupin domain-containing protein n=1 Tax=Roseibium sp. TaxID=1936156 RepID=UPI003B52645D